VNGTEDCTFEYINDGLATIENYTVEFDQELEDYVLTLTGTNFGATVDNT
jgi:frataxin-like iron-binding protein CyaY